MKKNLFHILMLSLCLSLFQASEAQTAAKYLPGKTPVGFENEINNFLRIDSAAFPPEGACLFTGSSTIRLWKDLSEDFSGIILIQRGFGGSTMKALNYYIHDIVLPYRPANIVVYEGDNDLAAGTTPQEFVAQCDTFIRQVRQALPNTTIWFLSLKPSFVRKNNLAAQQEANRMLRELAGKNSKTRFIDITGLMYDRQGNLRGDLFEPDSLHVNRECYHDWARHMKKVMRIRK